jgi:hypothetical protein
MTSAEIARAEREAQGLPAGPTAEECRRHNLVTARLGWRLSPSPLDADPVGVVDLPAADGGSHLDALDVAS